METTPNQTQNPETPASPVLRLSAKAVQAVKRTFESQNLEGHVLRIGLVPGGCAGFSYDLDVTREARPGDVRFEQEGIQMAVEPGAVPMLQGTEIDYVEDGLKAGFAFKNPNARSSCGCGSSFQA